MRYFKNERDFTSWALKEARARGWLAGHLSNMRVVRRPPAAPGQAPLIRAIPDRDAAGFPDLVLVHPEHGLVFAELKMPGRRPDPEQIEWLRALRSAYARVFVWDTADQDEIVEVLDGKHVSLLDQGSVGV